MLQPRFSDGNFNVSLNRLGSQCWSRSSVFELILLLTILATKMDYFFTPSSSNHKIWPKTYL
ncbi:MAG TPA: hypothetical protein DEG17_22835 [Cyanobacteria bacterium UBA11149]|nr:hypothetical protein [Cyanobacteria bacterium UBA11367]HBE60274.1 hypothetical protein [Cyanobacteria bacterium UBA11366]HBK62091.1 hypothetical protein [Cyanobacteria bacterium UBA11166]HBR74227.1 hypothetical protein [Cyanobacteria bacterium UBA11159]HBS70263.1 hypothetical protein [Cyanobacteria bacterium UBA11153]HBW91619.1 hypothetical protein [Cyanobacteria bacterium UBA11149]HCA93475.1 hypothetical protein [Cyanobacteria bacterium UBA9226]